MADFIFELADKLGIQWSIPIIVLFWILSQFDFIKKFLGDRRRVHYDERKLLSEDMQRLINDLQGDADRQRQWRINETDRLDKVVDDLRQQIRTALETIASEQRGNARLRHALNNVLQAYSAMRDKMHASGLPVPRFAELRDLMELGYSKDDYPWLYGDD